MHLCSDGTIDSLHVIIENSLETILDLYFISRVKKLHIAVKIVIGPLADKTKIEGIRCILQCSFLGDFPKTIPCYQALQ